MARRSTSTASFGVSKRESHDASGFYRRFTPPMVSADSAVAGHRALDKLIAGDARHMDEVPDASVALVVTSPPYFAGKEYEQSLGEHGVPATYLEYLDLLRDVFAECVRKLEPGGRIAVNVANLGRRPYRSLSADVISILQDHLHLLLRGEIIWLKQRGASGSCAWGSFQKSGNPVLRDLSERVIVASKGRFDRALSANDRSQQGLPSESSMTREDFMENTLDVWEIPAESATSVGHPAPFPVELPARLIELYTYRGDLVLDPFVGSGSTAVAAIRGGRHYVGYDLDGSYIELAETRVAAERDGSSTERVVVSPDSEPTGGEESPFARAIREGRSARDVARFALEEAGFTELREDQNRGNGITVTFTGKDSLGNLWCFDVAGGFTRFHPGLIRTDLLWKVLGRAAVLHAAGGSSPSAYVVLATSRPTPRSAGASALAQVTGNGKPVRAVVEIVRSTAIDELQALCHGLVKGP